MKIKFNYKSALEKLTANLIRQDIAVMPRNLSINDGLPIQQWSCEISTIEPGCIVG